jgi:hypothetical protein
MHTALETQVKKENELGGEFQLAELEQRLEMASAGSPSFYYCCMCFNNVACQMA